MDGGGLKVALLLGGLGILASDKDAIAALMGNAEEGDSMQGAWGEGMNGISDEAGEQKWW
jgi:hypothetical protein